MKEFVYYLLCISFFLSVVSCDNQFMGEEDKLKQENIEVLTKSLPVVCVDLFVNWDGSELYIGTACNSGGSSGGGGTGSIIKDYDPDDIIESPPYTSDDIPGGGGGGTTHYNPSTGKQEYVFSNLGYIYDSGSTLDLAQKDKLNKLMRYFLSTAKNRELFEYMIAEKVKIKFHCDSNAKDVAYYNPSTKSIVIKDLDGLLIFQLQEEFIHSVQHQCFYGDRMLFPSSISKNCEFEAKVYFDLCSGLNGFEENFIVYETDNRVEFRSKYKEWLLDIANRQHGRFVDVVGFNDLCSEWLALGYSETVFSPSFECSLLLRFFRKPVPPTPPLSGYYENEN